MTTRDMAERIARRLFTNGQKERADRLLLVRDVPSFSAPFTDLGGLCFAAAVDWIEDELRHGDRYAREEFEQARAEEHP